MTKKLILKYSFNKHPIEKKKGHAAYSSTSLPTAITILPIIEAVGNYPLPKRSVITNYFSQTMITVCLTKRSVIFHFRR